MANKKDQIFETLLNEHYDVIIEESANVFELIKRKSIPEPLDQVKLLSNSYTLEELSKQINEVFKSYDPVKTDREKLNKKLRQVAAISYIILANINS